MNINEVEKVALGALNLFLQAVHPLVLHIQHIFSWKDVKATKNRLFPKTLNKPGKLPTNITEPGNSKIENSPSAIMSCVLCGGLSALLSISWLKKLNRFFGQKYWHLKSSAYGLILAPVSVNNILEQSVGQFATDVSKALRDSNLTDSNHG